MKGNKMKTAFEIFWGAADIVQNNYEHDKESSLITVPEKARERLYMEYLAASSALAEQLLVSYVQSGNLDASKPMSDDDRDKLVNRLTQLAEAQVAKNVVYVTRRKREFKEAAKKYYEQSSLIKLPQ